MGRLPLDRQRQAQIRNWRLEMVLALCLVMLAGWGVPGLAGPIQPSGAGDRPDRNWMEFLPDGLRGGLDVASKLPAAEMAYQGRKGPWAGFEYGVDGPTGGLGDQVLTGRPPDRVAPGSLTESAFYGPVHPTAVAGESVDLWAVLGVGRPANGPAATLTGSPAPNGNGRRYGAAVASAGASVEERTASDILAVIPEPATLGLLALGGGLALARRHRRA
jgi:hypothetical protein